jgi:hypothetical protein
VIAGKMPMQMLIANDQQGGDSRHQKRQEKSVHTKTRVRELKNSCIVPHFPAEATAADHQNNISIHGGKSLREFSTLRMKQLL